MRGHFSFLDVSTNIYTLERYKKLIIKIAFLLSTITFFLSILSIVLVKICSQDQSATYADLDIDIEGDTKPKTYLYIIKKESSVFSSTKGKKNDNDRPDCPHSAGEMRDEMKEERKDEENNEEVEDKSNDKKEEVL
ncbi:conserved Plasmodium protein, unknown function [Plasmodium malariae]|uniref:Uncharacterized protein n=1 Tax=Plasmodium malariae TaxID=5858 RepID=A0A1C3L113_PLAMA|nr:conserved Plasmodium protein, unknown function [Plasmodium malariae]